MAIDPQSTTQNPPSGTVFRLNDDIPTYRAVSPLAVIAFLFGLFSVLTFTSLYFAVFGVMSLVIGVLAERSIRRYSDVLTGSKMVRLGYVLSLIFCLSALTIVTVNDVILRIEASRYGHKVADTLAKGAVNDFFYLRATPMSRGSKTPAQIAEEMEHGSQNPMAFEMETKPIRELKARLASTSDQVLSYEGLTGHASDGLNARAAVLMSIKGTPSGEFKEPVEYAFAQIRGIFQNGQYDWFVEDLQYPYRRFDR